MLPGRPVEANVPAAVPLVNDAGPFKVNVYVGLPVPAASTAFKLPMSKVASFLVVIDRDAFGET